MDIDTNLKVQMVFHYKIQIFTSEFSKKKQNNNKKLPSVSVLAATGQCGTSGSYN